MNQPSKIHLERNRITRDDWDVFAPHRARVTELLLDAAPESGVGSLCIFGAGNGNDLDLAALGERYSRITLVDLDDEALRHCVAKQSTTAKLQCVAGVDLSGIAERLDAPTDDEIDEIISVATDPPLPVELATCDVVASTCLVTQLIDMAAIALGADHPRFNELALAIRDGHLRMLGRLTAEGGRVVLITDVVSSDTLPQLLNVSIDKLEPLLARAIEAGNFFTGVNPAVLYRRIQDTSGGRAMMHAPWLWSMGDRVYGVVAITTS